MDNTIRQIGTISRALDTIANIEFKSLGVSKGQYVHLVRIAEKPGITLRQLSGITYIDETTCSRSINKLEKQGLIYKQQADNNKKNKMLHLTDKGNNIVNIIQAEHEYTNQRIIGMLNDVEIKQLSSLLEKVTVPILEDLSFVKKNGKREY